jgi:hypothetical protein
MKKSIPFLIMLLGILLITCNAVALLAYFWPQLFPELCFVLSLVFGIVPLELLMVIPFEWPLEISATISIAVPIIGIICGLGLALSNRIFRVLTIILAAFKLLCVIAIRVIIIKIIFKGAWQTADILSIGLPLLVPLVYIIFLIRSSVKEYFAQYKTNLGGVMKKLLVIVLVVLVALGITVYLNTKAVVYKSQELGISITVPKSWEFTTKDEPAQWQEMGEEGYQERRKLFVAVKDIESEETSPKIMLGGARYFDRDSAQKPFAATFEVEDSAQGYLDTLKKVVQFEVLEGPEKISLDGVPAVTFMADFGKTKQVYTAIIHNDTAYVLQCIAYSDQDLKDNRDLFDKVLKSVKFDEKDKE